MNYYRKHNSSLTPNAQKLRKNMTSQEKKLWYGFLRNHNHRFLRQKIIDYYIADFYCAKAKLIIEIDGSQHYTPVGLEYDKIRTYVLEQFGLVVIRFTNSDINDNFHGVCEVIDKYIKDQCVNNNPSTTAAVPLPLTREVGGCVEEQE